MEASAGRFLKNCKLKTCTKEFTSDSRNTAYCSDKCKETAKKKGHLRAKRRRVYARDPETRRAQSASRRQFREEGLNIQCYGICQRCGEWKMAAEIEFHHRDGNPFNNDHNNRAALCKPCHALSDTEWRKCKEMHVPIPDVRLYDVRLVPKALASPGMGTQVLSTFRTTAPEIPKV